MYEEILKEAEDRIPNAKSSIDLRLGIPVLSIVTDKRVSEFPILPGDAGNPKEFVMGIASTLNA